MKRLMMTIFLFCLLGLPAFSAEQAQTSETKSKLRLILFYSSHCGACLKLENEYIPVILKKYGDAIELEQKEINEKKQHLEQLLTYNPEGTVPTMVVPSLNKVFVGVEEIETNVTPIIKDFVAGKLSLASGQGSNPKKKP